MTAEVRKEARDLPEIEFVRVGKRQLKGVSVKVELFEVRGRRRQTPEKAVDPVCGMELGAGEIAARLSARGRGAAFCSEECLRKFVASPEAMRRSQESGARSQEVEARDCRGDAEAERSAACRFRS